MIHRNKWLVAIVVVTALAGWAIGFADAGDSTDPLITLSYLEMRLAALDGSSPSDGTSAFAVLNVQAGQVLTLGGSAEAILRSGRATAFVSDRGGLADVTAGRDLTAGETIPANHLIICPLSDGRGFRFASDSWVMVRGAYTLQ